MTYMVKFNGKEDFYNYFKEMAERNGDELNDNFCIEGNSDTRFGWLRNIAEQVGYQNVSVDDNTYYVSTVDINVSKAPQCSFSCNSDNSRYTNGVISLWWD